MQASQMLNQNLLTPREQEILTLMAHDKEVPHVAQHLGISKRQVYRDLDNMCVTLGVSNTKALMLAALTMGLIRPSGLGTWGAHELS